MQRVSYSTAWLLVLALILLPVASHSQEPSPYTVFIICENQVDFALRGGPWAKASVGQQLSYGDRVRTGEYSRATLRLPNGSLLPIDELSTVHLLPPRIPAEKPKISLLRGALYFFSRSGPEEIEFSTPTASGAIKGTEFELHLGPDQSTILTLLEGQVDLIGAGGSISMVSGEQGIVRRGQAPVKTAVIDAVNIIQWCLYYPAVLNSEELQFTTAQKNIFAASLDAYRRGNLLNALAAYPSQPAGPQNDAARLYLAGLLLATGQVDEIENLLTSLNPGPPQASAIRELIAAVKGQPISPLVEPRVASQWLARSYLLQSQGDLEGAREASRRAMEEAPRFGFAWSRLAEMEFSYGRLRETLEALDESLELSPENPQAMALRGFILAGHNRNAEALDEFNRAIAIDGALANAWLGRGLTKIHGNEFEQGKQDLQTAAAIEPNRSLLRSYLAKAFSDSGDFDRAENELFIAENLDPKDPTPWLFSALLKEDKNRFNPAVRDLEKSVQLNENRRLYRSRFLLDQDRAVRSANLASIFNKVGMNEISLREADRAVRNDYSNYSAHLFLANSYDALRDPRRFHLRFETPWANELLLANLLAPASAGVLSQNVSLQEYTPLFERDRLGFNSQLTYRSHGEFRLQSTQYGLHGNTSYSIDLDYHTFDGFRSNNDFDRWEVSVQLKHQVSPRDSLFVMATFQDFEGGDSSQIQDLSLARPDFRFEEEQLPILFGGYHRRWAPGVDTLVLIGRLSDKLTNRDIALPHLILRKDGSGEVIDLDIVPMDLSYQNELEIYTAELNHIVQGPKRTFLFGARYQNGAFDAQNRLDGLAPPFVPIFEDPPADLRFKEDFTRVNIYGYAFLEFIENLTISLGVAYDYLEYPINLWLSPISRGTKDKDQVSPKIGFNWQAHSNLVLRGVYAQSIGGVSFDESVRLEPTQISGFNQGFRTLISESIIGAGTAPDFETIGLGLTYKSTSNIYLDIQATTRNTDVDRFPGTFTFSPAEALIQPDFTTERLDYREERLKVTLNHLYGDNLAWGARYEIINSVLDTRLAEIFDTRTRVRSTLQRWTIFGIVNHPTGFFVQGEGRWLRQHNRGFPGLHPDEDFLQLDALFGYRTQRQRWAITIGVLNITDKDYRLNPLTPFLEEPRERTLFLQLKLNW